MLFVQCRRLLAVIFAFSLSRLCTPHNPIKVLFLIKINFLLLRGGLTAKANSHSHPTGRWGPEFPSRLLHVGVMLDKTKFGSNCQRVSTVFLYHKFHSTISAHSSHSFSFISSAGILPIHTTSIKGLHRISSLDQALCRTRIEDFLCF